jgi:hypothetical protein
MPRSSLYTKVRETVPPAKLAGQSAYTRSQVSLYDANWRTGDIGEHLSRAVRPSIL